MQAYTYCIILPGLCPLPSCTASVLDPFVGGEHVGQFFTEFVCSPVVTVLGKGCLNCFVEKNLVSEIDWLMGSCQVQK